MRGLIDLAKRLEGPRAQRRHARRRRRHRAAADHRVHAALRGCRRRVADAARQGRSRGDRPHQVRLPGLKTLTIIDKAVAAINRERAGRGEPPLNVDAIPVDDAKTYELLRQCRTTAVFQLESLGMRDLDQALAARSVRRPHGDRRAVSARADADGRRVHRAQASRRRDARLSASAARDDAEADLRRDPLSRAGHADRAGSGRLLARRRRSAAARHGQEEARGDGRAAQRVPEGRDGARRRAGAREPHLRSDGDVRRLRLQQVARRGVRADRVSDGVAQDALSRGVHGRRADGRHGQHRSARRAQGRAEREHGHRARAARRQSLGLCRSPSPARSASATGSGRSKASARAPSRRSSTERDAHGAVHEPRRPLPARRSDEDQPARARGARAVRRARLLSARIARR